MMESLSTTASKLAAIFSSKRFRFAAGLILSGLTLYLALHNVDFQQVWQAIFQANWRYVSLALGSVAVNTLAKSVRWRVLLGEDGRPVPFSRLLMSLLAGQMLNTVYPARIGDLSRAYVVGGMGPGRAFTLGTVLIEKLLDAISYALFFFLLLVLIPLPAWINESVYAFTLVVLIAAGAVGILAYHPHWMISFVGRVLAWFPGRIQAYLDARLRSGVASLGVLKSRKGLVRLAFWSAVSWGTAILNNQLILLSLHIRLSWTAALLVLMVLQAGISIPSVPGKIGIFEYSCVLALAVFGVEQASALSYGIVLHTIVLFPTTLLGLVFFWLLGLYGQRAVIQASLPGSEVVAPDTQG